LSIQRQMVSKLGHHYVGQQACRRDAFVDDMRRYRRLDQRLALLTGPFPTDMAFDGKHAGGVVELFAGIFADTLEGAAALAVAVFRFVMDQHARKLRWQRSALGLLAHFGFDRHGLQRFKLSFDGGDIGVHAFNVAEFWTGEKVTRLLADLAAVVPGRALDDDCSILLRFANGARGVLLASQIEVGELNGLRIRCYGEFGGMSWKQEEPNSFTQHHADGRTEIVRAADASLGPAAASRTRTPGGHPEGYLEAFANIYRDFAAVLRGEDAPLLPGIADGLRGMTFIDTAVRASAANAGWVDLAD